MLTAVHLLLIATSGSQDVPKPDLKTMQMASYMAGSLAVDQQAPGGNGTSANYPVKLVDLQIKANSKQSILKKTDKGFSITLANGSRSVVWFNAGDGRIHAWLEAKDEKGKWKPIEYLPWYSCGNSYHRVQLPADHGWKWSVKLPKGDFKTTVRWHYKHGDDQLYSNEVKASIPSTRFQLSAKQSKASEIRTDWGNPTLMPKNFGR